MSTYAERFSEKGSFDGIPFHAEKHTERGGRRLVVDQYPNREDPDFEDLGRSQLPRTLDLFVWGENYDAVRDNLRYALDAAGPHRLSHPWAGDMQVHVSDWTLTETDEDGGLAKFSIEFHRVPAPSTAPWDLYGPEDVAVAAETSAPEIFETFYDDFNGVYEPVKASQTASPNARPLAPAWVREDARLSVEESLSTLDALLAASRVVPEVAAEIAERITTTTAQLSTLIRTPYNLAAEITGLINDTSKALEEPGDAVALYRSLSEFGFYCPDLGALTPSARLLQANRSALVKLIRQAATVAAANAVMAVAYASRAEALVALEEWEVKLDDLGLTDLRAVLVEAMRATSARLPDVVTLTLPQDVPALVLANRLYGPADVAARAGEIVDRNHVRHPSRLPAGTLEVLDG